jgi:hypothetical protein
MFRALLAHPALHKRQLVHCLRVFSAGCYHDWSGAGVCWGWVSNARNMYRPLILNKLKTKCVMLVSLYRYVATFMQQSTSWRPSVGSDSQKPRAFHGTRHLFTFFTNAWNVPTSWAISIIYTPSHPLSLGFIPILFTYPHLVLPHCLFIYFTLPARTCLSLLPNTAAYSPSPSS